MRPRRADLEAARGRAIPDVLAPDLKVLFCGINPSLYSGAVGHHFARPGNRFWPALAGSGFTDRLLSPFEDAALPAYGLGCTNLVNRATARADQLGPEELKAGATRLRVVVSRLRPRWLAVLGIGAYRLALGDARAAAGPQEVRIDRTRVWLLPNPSGLNAHYQLPDLVAAFAQLRQAACAGYPAVPPPPDTRS